MRLKLTGRIEGPAEELAFYNVKSVLIDSRVVQVTVGRKTADLCKVVHENGYVKYELDTKAHGLLFGRDVTFTKPCVFAGIECIH